MLIQEWDSVRTDWLTLRPVLSDWPESEAVTAV